ncbi:hypothetical protein DDT91_12665 [Algoriphagus sp. AK58]|nr:hypothetical protein [Algoriphagus sp. AK58]
MKSAGIEGKKKQPLTSELGYDKAAFETDLLLIGQVNHIWGFFKNMTTEKANPFFTLNNQLRQS